MYRKYAGPICFALLFALTVGVCTAYAQPPDPSPDPAGPVNDAIAQFAAALGLGGAVSAFVQVLKAFGIVPDGRGGQVVLVFNLVLFIAATIAGFFGLDVGDEVVKEALVVIGTLLVTIFSSILYFKGMRDSGIWGFQSRTTT